MAALRLAYRTVLVVCAVTVTGRLVLGGLVVGREPGRQAAVEFGLALLTVGLGVAVLIAGRRDLSLRLLGLALLATGGVGDRWTRATTDALALPRPATGDILLSSVALAAFASVLLAYPVARRRRLIPGRDEFLTAVGGAAVLGAAAATVLEPTVSQAVLFGVALPAVGLVLLRHRGRDDLTAAERAQVRLLSGVLAAAATIAVALQVVTVLRWSTGRPAEFPLFWFGHLVPIAVAVSALTAGRRERLHAVQRRFSRGLVGAVVATLLGGLFVVLHTGLGGHPRWATLIAAAPVAVLLHPVQVRVERWVDRLLYGRRPTPYSVLAGIGTVSRTSLMNAPDLARVAETVGRGLGARVCRLTVHRPDRPDRTYAWAVAGADEGDALLTLPIVRGTERLGSITVDRQTAAGPNLHRHRLVEDIADSLGAVLEANLLGVELERQLRAVRAHAADIAGSRRRLVAEMDAERRRIERDLHDGAQHHLVSLRLSLGLVEHRVSTGRFADAVTSLDRVTGQIDDAEAIMARTAVGVASPLLVRQGLLAALTAELGAGRPVVPVAVVGMDGGRRFPADLESAVWFCCLEAVNNARKYASEARIELTLTCGRDRLEFGVHDDGPGWDLAANAGSPGRGMRNVMARVTAVGGLVTVWSEPGAGARVDGWVPLPEPPPVGEPLVVAVQEAIEDARTRYPDAPAAQRVRQVGADLDASVAPAADGAPPTRRTVVLAASAALRALDALARDEPLLHRLDRIRSQTADLAEVEAIDTLRSDAGDLGADDVETAARLLGESGSDSRSRLGLAPQAGQAAVVTAAEQALAAWRVRAAHPGTAPGVRVLAATVVRSCEHLLHGG
ncbi:sensor histidine kinase [Micromonosporaceae bacterium Da 78-11]